MLNGMTLFISQLFAHLGLLVLLFRGSFFHWGITFLIYFLTGCFGITMTYHRYWAHRSWSAPVWFRYMATCVATLGLVGSALSWTSVHRKHHRFSDTPQDPHSPAHKGIFYCQWLSMFEPVEMRYIVDLIKSRPLLLQHKYYFLICGIYTALLAIIDPFAVVYAFLAPACILWNASALIVTASHLIGSKPHHTKSNARNSWILGILVWGEGWHNNHHYNAGSPYFSEKLWQIDIGGMFIRFFEELHRFSKIYGMYLRKSN